jgi:hypothetical protein
MATARATKRWKLPQRESPLEAVGTSYTAMGRACERAAGRVAMPTSPATAKRTATKRAGTSSTAMCTWDGSASVLPSRRKLSGGVGLRLPSRLTSRRPRRSCCGDLRSGAQLLRSRMTRYLPCCTDADFNEHRYQRAATAWKYSMSAGIASRSPTKMERAVRPRRSSLQDTTRR